MASEATAGAAPNLEPSHAHVGRPRTQGTDEAILAATLELLSEVGLQGTTMGAVAQRAGVARATVYLRWPTRESLIAGAARVALGQPPFPLTGDIEADIRKLAQRARVAVQEPLFVAIFPEIARVLLSRASTTAYDDVAPNRQRLAAIYRETADARGFRSDIDPTVVFDLIVGSILNHLLATGDTPSNQAADQIADVIIAGLRRRQ